jgi:hypothetical protein
MKYKGINYDTGTKTIAGGLTRETFDPDIIAAGIDIIKNELHCNAIRISGLDIERISLASEIALKAGLVVWFSPSLRYDNQENTLQYILAGAHSAEILRKEFPNLVFIVGCELSLFTSGFVKGNTWDRRLKNMFSPISLLKSMIGIKRNYNRRLHTFLSDAVNRVKKIFRGEITYASGAWEKVDWNIFDITGVDLYRSAFNKSIYEKELRNYKKIGKPTCITEFGCCAYDGADDKGAMGWSIADWKKKRPELRAHFTRNEDVQSKYLLELLNIFESEDVFAAFVFTFISYNYTWSDNPLYDLDMASYGIVKSIPGDRKAGYKNLGWIPKKAFYDLGNYYRDH